MKHKKQNIEINVTTNYERTFIYQQLTFILFFKCYHIVQSKLR